MKIFLGVLAFGVVASLAAAPAAGSHTKSAPQRLAGDEIAERVRAYVTPFETNGQLSGTLLVARNGQIVLEESYGMANYELGVPNTPATRFCVASITKPVTIAVLSQLAEEKKLSPEDPVSRWIDGFPRGGEITVSHLLNHTAGIAHRVTTREQESAYISAGEMVELVKKTGLASPPGEKPVYSSAGFSVLARIIELVEGKPYGQVIRERIFVPSGMTRSAHPGCRELVPDRASSYAPGPDGPLHSRLMDTSFLVGAGSVYSTPGDLLAFTRALLEGRLGEVPRTALLRDDGLHWNGITNGYRAFVEHSSETGVTVIFAGNMHTGATELLRDTLPLLAAGQEAPPPPEIDVERAQVPLSVLRGYEGTYISDRDQEITVTVNCGGVWADDWVLIPTSETTFFSPQDYGTVTVVFDESRRVIGLDWNWKGQVMTRFTRRGREEGGAGS